MYLLIYKRKKTHFIYFISMAALLRLCCLLKQTGEILHISSGH